MLQRFDVNVAKGTLKDNFKELEDQVSALNFETEDVICTNGQLAQTKMKNLFEYFIQNFSFRGLNDNKDCIIAKWQAFLGCYEINSFSYFLK